MEKTYKLKGNPTHLSSLGKFEEPNIKFGFSLKEEISMTELGRMLIEDGRTEGKIETLIKLLIKKFGFLSEEYKSKISKLSNETIDIILMEIFDIKSINELDKYFSK